MIYKWSPDVQKQYQHILVMKSVAGDVNKEMRDFFTNNGIKKKQYKKYKRFIGFTAKEDAMAFYLRFDQYIYDHFNLVTFVDYDYTE